MRIKTCYCCTGATTQAYVNPEPKLTQRHRMATLDPSACVCEFCFDASLVKDFYTNLNFPIKLRLDAYLLKSILMRSERHGIPLDSLQPFHAAVAIEPMFFFNLESRAMTRQQCFIASVLNAHRIGVI